MVENLLGLFFGQLQAEVHETPTEVIQIELSIRVIVHCLEDLRETTEATRGRSLENLCLDLTNQILDSELIQLLHWKSILGAWGSNEVEDVLVLLEFGRKITSDFTVFFQRQILRTVLGGETMHENLELLTEIILDLVVV